MLIISSNNKYNPEDIENGESGEAVTVCLLSTYAVEEGSETIGLNLSTFNFESVTYDYVSTHVREQLVQGRVISSIVRMLIGNDETDSNSDPCNMAVSTLYYSTNPCYPTVGMMLKRGDGKVTGWYPLSR